MTALLTARGVTKRFGDMVAVDGVDIAFEAGKVAGIIGPNGAGKTTLVHLLTGHVLPDSGAITFDGEDISQMPSYSRVRRRLCRTFQIVDVFERLSVIENVQLAILTREGRNLGFFRPAARLYREEAEAALERVGMQGFRHRKAEQLSHGQQRRLDLAITLATRPKLCFLDEPTSGVSPQERDQMLELIRSLAQDSETTFALIEHDMPVIFDLCDWITVMHKGAVLAQGTPEDIRTNDAVREVYLGEDETVSAEREEAGTP